MIAFGHGNPKSWNVVTSLTLASRLMVKYIVVSSIGVEPTKHSKLCKRFNQIVKSFTFYFLYSFKAITKRELTNSVLIELMS